MLSEQHHKFDNRINFERFGFLVWICKSQGIAEFRYPMLYLNSRVHFHKEMSVSVENTFEC